MKVTIEDVKEILSKGYDPRSTVNKMIFAFQHEDEKPEKPEKPKTATKKSFLKKKSDD